MKILEFEYFPFDPGFEQWLITINYNKLTYKFASHYSYEYSCRILVCGKRETGNTKPAGSCQEHISDPKGTHGKFMNSTPPFWDLSREFWDARSEPYA